MAMIHRVRQFLDAMHQAVPPDPAPLRHTKGQIASISTVTPYYGTVYVDGSTTDVPCNICIPSGGGLAVGTVVEVLITGDLVIVIGGYP